MIDHNERELVDKDRQLAEARVEIERLKSEHEDSLRRAKDNAVSLSSTVTEQAGELLAKDKQLTEARAEIEQLKQLWSCNLDIIGGELYRQLTEARAEIEKQDTLLKKCLSLLKQQKERGE